MKNVELISVREKPETLEEVIAYFQRCWASEDSMMVYDDAIRSALMSDNPLPQWVVLKQDDQIIGCAGLIPNDFISRMDLWPWLCALYVDEAHRGKGWSRILVEAMKQKASELGFEHLYLCTDHIGYYERFGFHPIGTGYHPWGESSTIYAIQFKEKNNDQQ